jgi:excisionase family DNA binding protein
MARSADTRRADDRSAAGSAPSGRLVPLATAAEELSVSVKTIRRRIAEGSVPAYRIGRLIRVNLDELRAALVVVVGSSH